MEEYWNLNGKQFDKYLKVYREKEENRIKEQDYMNFLLGKYIAYAFNNPKKYPNKPFLHNMGKKKTMTDEEMEREALKNTILMGGKKK